MKTIHREIKNSQDEDICGQFQQDVEYRQLEEALLKTQAELKALRKEYKLMEAVVDTVSSYVVVLDRLGRIIRFNHACQEITNYTVDEAKGKHLWEVFFILEEVETIKTAFKQLWPCQNSNKCETYWITKEGERRAIAWSNTVIIDSDGTAIEYIVLTGSDITERKQTEKEFRQCREHIKDIVEDSTAELRKANEELQEEIAHLARTEAELRTRHQELLTLHHISEIALNAQSLEAAYQIIVEEISSATGFPIVAIELYDSAREVMVFAGAKGIALPANQSVLEVPVAQTLSGTVARTNQPVVKTYITTESKQCDSNEILNQLGIRTFICLPMTVNQQTLGVLSLAHSEIVQCDDYFVKWIASLANYIASLTSRQQSQEALRHSEERYRQIIETAAEGIWILDAESNTSFVNGEMAEMLGYTVEEMLGMPLLAFMDEEGKGIALENLERRSQGIKEQHDFKFRRKDGSELWAIVSTNPILDRSGKYAGALGMITDITHRKQAESALRQQTAREKLMAEVAVRIRQSLNLTKILNTTAAEVRQFLQTDRVLIYRFDPDWSGVVVVESVAPNWMPILGKTIHDRCFAQKYVHLYKKGRIKATENIYTGGLAQCHVDLLASFQVKANLVVPIFQGEQLWGMLIAHHCSQPKQWQQLEIDLLEQLSTQVAIAIQQAELYQQLQAANQELQRLACLDGLTHVANRRRFDEYLEQEWRRHARQQTSLSLIMCDIDFFKLYNDTYGHPAGDVCLRQVADALSRTVSGRSPLAPLKKGGKSQGSTDLVARYGGEEFAVILSHTNAEGAVRVAEEILLQIRALKITHVKSPSQHVTLSLGVASTLPGHATSPSGLIAAADRALYQAKREGRDRFCRSV